MIKEIIKKIQGEKWTGLREYYPNQKTHKKIYSRDTIISNGVVVTVIYVNGQFYPREIYLQNQYNKII